MDIYYDYFLGKNWSKFSTEDLKEFATSIYDDFEELQENFPQKVIDILPSMRKNDWFYNYQFYWGIEKSLLSIQKRAHYSNNIGEALKHMKENEVELEKDFLEFFPDLIAHCEAFLTKNKYYL
jgi:acyl carrier protein phosphodiesterase